MNGFMVNKKLCETCIFSARTPISPERFQELKAAWAENDVIQECHTSTIAGGHVGCRGHYEAARQGDIPHPLTAIWGAMGVTGQTVADLMQWSERMGFVSFVNINDKDSE